jgi:hypothetical protein
MTRQRAFMMRLPFIKEMISTRGLRKVCEGVRKIGEMITHTLGT